MQLWFIEHPKELTEEEKQQIVHSEDFLVFFNRSIRVVERTLAEDIDIFFDYSGRDMENKDGWEKHLIAVIGNIIMIKNWDCSFYPEACWCFKK